MQNSEISADFPFESRYVDIKGSKIHYIDVGKGDPVLFIHGNPTSSYLWRNIIPHVKPFARCIALDLIGFGKSDKPDIGYRIKDHYEYLNEFINVLNLQNITLVIHDWGSALGFHYASLHEDNIKGIAFMESIIKTYSWSEFPSDFRMGFKLFRTPVMGWLMIGWFNIFVEKILPKAIVRKLSDAEKEAYKASFKNIKDRKPVWVFPNEIPVEGNPPDIAEMVMKYNKWLQESNLPKLLFYASPGGIINGPSVKWCKSTLKKLKAVDIGQGIHYLQEDNPNLIGKELASWYQSL